MTELYNPDPDIRKYNPIKRANEATMRSRTAGVADNLNQISTRLHSDLQSIGEADNTDTNTTKDKHVSNNDMKVLEDHRTATENEHGATGALIGAGDKADESTYGVVKRAATQADAAVTAADLTDSTTGTATQTINDVGAAYSQSTLNNNFASLTDEVKKLVTDVTDAKDKLNALIDKLQAAGLMT